MFIPSSNGDGSLPNRRGISKGRLKCPPKVRYKSLTISFSNHVRRIWPSGLSPLRSWLRLDDTARERPLRRVAALVNKSRIQA